MSYELINDDEKEKYQELFEKILKHNTKDLGVRKISDPGGFIEANIYWSSEHEYWYLTTERENHWTNAFGLEKPEGNNAEMIGLINISFRGWRCEGRLVKNTASGAVCVAHNGKYTINGKYDEEKEKHTRITGNILSDERFAENRILITIDGNEKEAVLICEFPKDELEYSNFQREIKKFIKEYREIKDAARENNNPPPQKNTENSGTILIKNPTALETNVESSNMIAKRIKKIILKINEKCRLKNKKPIFDQAALFELWDNIENPTKDENDFKSFSENLYKLIREKTRYKKNKADTKYIFLLPPKFIKINTPTRHFWDIVNTFRHYKTHDEIGNMADIYKELLGKNKWSGPESTKDYLKLQIEVLKLFENSMKILLEIVKNDV